VAKSKKSDKKKSSKKADQPKAVAENRKARHNYEILDTLECGIMLVGSEVKSLREGKCSLEEAYGRMKGEEVWLIGADIQEYAQASRMNHKTRRDRKLLMHKREFHKFAEKAMQKGLTLIPLKIYFNKEGNAKILMGIGKGRQVHDKREAMKEKDAKRDIQRTARRGGRWD